MSAKELDDLKHVIRSRKGGDIETSRTARHLSRGVPRCARKVGEEAVEVVVAVLGETRAEVISESADMLYHWLVLLESLEIDADEVYAELARRRGVMETEADGVQGG